MKVQPAHILAAVSSVMVIFAALLPWATVDSAIGEIGVSGTDGDGVITLVLGLGALEQ